jgi:hypothetical protein
MSLDEEEGTSSLPIYKKIILGETHHLQEKLTKPKLPRRLKKIEF